MNIHNEEDGPKEFDTERVGFRQLQGGLNLWCKLLLMLIPLFGILFVLNVHLYFHITMYNEQYLGLYLALVLGSVYLLYPSSKKGPWNRVPWYDVILSLMGIAVGIYLLIEVPKIAWGTKMTWVQLVFAGIAIPLVIEASRRTLGWIPIILTCLGIVYLKLGFMAPGVLQIKKIGWSHLLTYMYSDANAMLGIALYIIATIVLGFFLLGEVIEATGGADFIIEFATRVAGRAKGGPAKVAVIGSGLFGMVTGSAVANAVFVGRMTIPMMKKIGYPPYFAGAVEATASNGGQIMPPVMGVTAFIIANFLGVGYGTVVKASIIPALLYYAALFIQIDAESTKLNLQPFQSADKKPFSYLFKKSYSLLIPVVVLVYTLFIMNLEGGPAAIYTAFVLLLAGIIFTRGSVIRRIPGMLERVGRSSLTLGAMGGICGFFLGAMSLSGLSFNLGMQLVIIGEQSMILFAMLVAAVSIILGMGMPTVVVYVLLASLLGGALQKLGLYPLAAHLYLQYFGVAAMITPPVCYAAFVAAEIAGAGYFKVGFEACRLSIGVYLVPLMFLFNHGLLMEGSAIVILRDTVVTTAIMFVVAWGVSGWTFNLKLNSLERGCATIIPIAFVILQPLVTPILFWGGSILVFMLLIYFLVKAHLHRRVLHTLAAALIIC